MFTRKHIAFLFGVRDRVVDNPLLLVLLKFLAVISILKNLLCVSLVARVHDVSLSYIVLLPFRTAFLNFNVFLQILVKALQVYVQIFYAYKIVDFR